MSPISFHRNLSYVFHILNSNQLKLNVNGISFDFGIFFQAPLKDEVLNSLMSLTPAAWKTIRSAIQSLLLENSALDRNSALKEKYEMRPNRSRLNHKKSPFVWNLFHFRCKFFPLAIEPLSNRKTPFSMFQPISVTTPISIRPFIMPQMWVLCFVAKRMH